MRCNLLKNKQFAEQFYIRAKSCYIAIFVMLHFKCNAMFIQWCILYRINDFKMPRRERKEKHILTLVATDIKKQSCLV